MLKREILYCGYTVYQRRVQVVLETETQPGNLIITYAIGKPAFLEFYHYLEQINLVDANTKFKKESQCIYGEVYFHGEVCQMKCEVDEDTKLHRLYLLSNSEVTATNEEGELFFSESRLESWIRPILEKGVKQDEIILFERIESPSQKGGPFSAQVLRKLSEVSVDSSTEKTPHVFRWAKESLRAHCNSTALISKKEAEKIITDSGFPSPDHGEMIGLSPFGEYASNPCLMARYVHSRPDQDFKKATPQPPTRYQNEGKIVVEGDFDVFYIDPDQKTVISEHRKWHQVRS